MSLTSSSPLGRRFRRTVPIAATRRRRSRLLLAVAVAAAVAVSGCSSSDGSGNPSEAASGSAHDMPTASARSMLLPESAFPSLPDAKFTIEEGPEEDSGTVIDDPRCDELLSFGDDDANDSATHDMTATHTTPDGSPAITSYGTIVEKGVSATELDKIDEALATCQTFTLHLGDGDTARVTLTEADLAVDGNARALVMNGPAELADGTILHTAWYLVVGTERGVGIGSRSLHVTETDSDTREIADNTAGLYNAQRQRVLDAD